jgi:hypothetical protein
VEESGEGSGAGSVDEWGEDSVDGSDIVLAALTALEWDTVLSDNELGNALMVWVRKEWV